MTQSATRPTEEKTGRTGRDALGPPESRGRTTIADSVAEKIAGMATREVPGIHDLGASGVTRALGGVRDRMSSGQSGAARGVHVEVGREQAAVDLDVVVDYGVPITDIAADVRTNVVSAMERMTGLEVVEVNVAVNDIDLPGDEDEEGGRVD
jgi:uncharacterized alkaline shock family protein YloU